MSGAPILAINSGSSTLKFGLFSHPDDASRGEERPLLRGSAEGIGKSGGKLEVFDAEGQSLFHEETVYPSQREALAHLTGALEKLHEPRPEAVGHRVVHGGAKLREHTRIDDEVLDTLEEAIHFAPLHIPTSIELIRAAGSVYPGIPQVACFDTAFHQTMPEAAWHYPLPAEFSAEGVRRYGFHGLSYEAILHRLGGDVPRRMIIAHLGNGASLAAVRDGQCIATTMGFSTLDGLVMGTRAGLIDPGVLLHLLRSEGFDLPKLEKLLYHESGLLALGGTADMKTLLDSRQEQAIEIYCERIAREIGSLTAALQGLDALIFTGGVGENAAPIRDRVTEKLHWLGLTDIRVIPTDEELTIARHARRLLA